MSFIEETGSNFTCNLIFIDGSHEYKDALLDIAEMRRLADKRFHRIIIDDTVLFEDVRRAVDDASSRYGLMHILDEVTTSETPCMRIQRVEEPMSEAGTYEFPLAPPRDCGSTAKSGSDSYDAVLVGEYIFT